MVEKQWCKGSEASASLHIWGATRALESPVQNPLDRAVSELVLLCGHALSVSQALDIGGPAKSPGSQLHFFLLQ